MLRLLFFNFVSIYGVSNNSLIFDKLQKSNQALFSHFKSVKDTFVLDEKFASDIDTLFHDPAMEELIKAGFFAFNDSSLYFLLNIARIFNESYIPTTEDIIASRSKTSGIQELKFKINDLPLAVIDVGGQRSERRKWVNCFSDITAVIFFTCLCEFDQKLAEDQTTNRLCESLKVFDEICNFQCLFHIPIILLFNKSDLLPRKLETKEITSAFPDYTGDGSFEHATKFMKEQFLQRNQNSERQIYDFDTCAADTAQMSKIIASITDIIIEQNVRPRQQKF